MVTVLQWLGFKPKPTQMKSPWSTGELNKVVASDVFGDGRYTPVTREDAMSIPAFSKARDLLCNTVGNLTLVDLTKDNAEPNPLVRWKPSTDQPKWLTHTEGPVSPYLRQSWTVDDLLHYGHSLWGKRIGTDGFPLAAWRIPYEDWFIDGDGLIKRRADLHVYDDEEIIYIPHHTAGVLDRAASTIRAAAHIGRAVEIRTKVPIPVVEFRITSDGDVGTDEAQALIDAYVLQRQDENGAVMVTPYGVEMFAHGEKSDSGFMVEGRNAVRLDMGNISGVPGSLLDGSTATATLTYSTTEGKRNEFHEFATSAYVAVLAGRLSQDDVSKQGHRVDVDLTNQNSDLPPNTNQNGQD